MNVSQLIDFLKTQDKNFEVLVVEHKSGRSYYDQGGNVREVEFDPEKHVDLCGSPYNTILLGSTNG